MLSAVVFRIYRRQPDDLGSHLKCGLYRFGVQSSHFIVQCQPAVHNKRIAVKGASVIGVAQRGTGHGSAMMPFDDDRSCSCMDGSGRQFQIVTGTLTNIRRCVNMHIDDAVQ